MDRNDDELFDRAVVDVSRRAEDEARAGARINAAAGLADVTACAQRRLRRRAWWRW